MWQRAKELADVKVMLHCCGGVRPLLADLIDAGLDCINPVQISCTGMDAGGLKRDFGADITFWGGGCDTQWLLAHGTPEAIREHVRRQVDMHEPRGRLRLPTGAQHLGRRPAREHRGPARRRGRAGGPGLTAYPPGGGRRRTGNGPGYLGHNDVYAAAFHSTANSVVDTGVSNYGMERL